MIYLVVNIYWIMFSLEPATLIKQFPLFDQDLASFISEEAETKIFNQDDVLMRPGQFFKYAMLVVRGRVKLFREGDEGEEFFMYYLEPGNACALSMLCMARSQSSSIMAVAVEETEVVMIPIQHMDNLMKNYPSWYHFVIETYRTRFEEVLNVIDQIAFKNMDQRLEWYLKRQSEVLGSNLTLTHQQIANDINSSREVVSRLLKKLENNGLVEVERNNIKWKG
jgi:CRP/FNR family transcriptional regulator